MFREDGDLLNLPQTLKLKKKHFRKKENTLVLLINYLSYLNVVLHRVD